MRLTHFIRNCVTGVVLLLGMSLRIASTPYLLGASFCCVRSIMEAGERGEPSRTYNLPRGDAADALRQFAAISGRPVLFMMDKVRGEQTNAISGDFLPAEALGQMLAGTALVAVQNDGNDGFVVSRSSVARKEVEYNDPKQPQPQPEPMISSAQAVPSSENKQAQVNPKGTKRLVSWIVSLFVIASAHTGFAQQTGQVTEPETPEKTITLDTLVVTGTQIRGIEPVGTNVLGLTKVDITRSGATDTNMLLAQIPQITSAFNQVPVLPTNDPGNSIIRPQLRNFGSSSGSTNTLVLVDGHRAVNAGITITSPDPGVIPPSVLEAIDVVPDGGSAIYGSDAVAGVINFITRRRFDGTQLDSHYGFADSYHTWDTNLTVGKDWGKGGAYISFSHAEHDAILGKDLSWYRQTTPNEGYGMPGTVVIGSTTYALPSRVPGTIAQVDSTDLTAFVPQEKRDSVFAVFNQELADSVELDVRAFYSKRTNKASVDAAGYDTNKGSGVITPANPFWVPIGAEVAQTVRFSYGSTLRENDLEEQGVTATLTTKLGRDWQLRTLLNWGRSTNEVIDPTLDQTAQAAAFAATTTSSAINPYDITKTSAAVLNGLFWNSVSRGRQTMNNARAVLDGPAFALPGGDVRVAAGAEYTKEDENFFFASSPTASVTTTPSREIKAGFAEVVVPLVGARNVTAGIHSLVLSAAARYDDYSVVGSTTNPKLGIAYKPVDWMTVRANWGKSFIAPSIADTTGAPDTRAIFFGPIGSGSVETKDIGTALENLPWIILAGGNPDLKPQKATTQSAGFDLRPPAIPGLTVSTTFYKIETENEISNLFAAVLQPQGFQALYQPQYSSWTIKNPSLSFTKDYLQTISSVINAGGGTSIDGLYALGGGSIYAIHDWRRNNLSLTKQSGVDFNVNYKRATGFGELSANLGGSYLLKRDVATAPGAPLIDSMDSPGINRLNLSASLGATIDNVFASATLRHSGSYDISPAVGGQTRVASFTTVDLYVSYDLKGEGWRRGLALTAHLGNVFDAKPPGYNGASGYANGSTLGRLFQAGVSKKF